jgi:hypothetical protein
MKTAVPPATQAAKAASDVAAAAGIRVEGALKRKEEPLNENS